ncbi:MAG: flavodoxin family protein [Anaerolineae bacterium]
MGVLVVYDSIFGNTEQIARAVGAVLGAEPDVQVVRVSAMTPERLAAADLVVVGSPTRGFRPTPATSKLLKSIPARGLQGVRVAAFDTRVDVAKVNSRVLTALAKVFGYAAEPIAKALQAKGGTPAGEPAGFLVLDREGPLAERELERAAAWARGLVHTR